MVRRESRSISENDNAAAVALKSSRREVYWVGRAGTSLPKSLCASLFAKQRFNVPRAVINMKHLNTVWDGAVKNQVVVKTRHAP